MKNDRTPRTVAKCDFTTGYPERHWQRQSQIANVIYGVIVIVCSAAIGAMLALGM